MRRVVVTAAATAGLLALAACGSAHPDRARCRSEYNLGEAWLARGEAANGLPAVQGEQQASQAVAEASHYLALMQAQHCPEVAK